MVYDFIEGTGYLRSLSGVSIWTDDSDEEDCGFVGYCLYMCGLCINIWILGKF